MYLNIIYQRDKHKKTPYITRNIWGSVLTTLVIGLSNQAKTGCRRQSCQSCSLAAEPLVVVVQVDPEVQSHLAVVLADLAVQNHLEQVAVLDAELVAEAVLVEQSHLVQAAVLDAVLAAVVQNHPEQAVEPVAEEQNHLVAGPLPQKDYLP